MTNRVKVVNLWTIFLFGMISHMLLAVVPIFWGKSVAMTQEQIAANPFESMIWMMLLFYLLPTIIILFTIFIEAKWYRITNFVLSLLFTLMNIFHVAEHLGTDPVELHQVVLLTFVLISGIFLNLVSFKWIKE